MTLACGTGGQRAWIALLSLLLRPWGCAPSCTHTPDANGHVSIPSGVTLIGDNAFNSCASLVSISIPSSVVSIGSGAFAGCSSLGRVCLPVGCVVGIGAILGTAGYDLCDAPPHMPVLYGGRVPIQRGAATPRASPGASGILSSSK